LSSRSDSRSSRSCRLLASRQIVTDPHVLVEVTTFGTQAIVQGQVGVPGVYTLDRPTNLTQLISLAGGLRDAAVGGTITVRRGRGGVLKFDSKDVQAARGPGASLRIVNRDEVFVDLAPFYYLYGYVGIKGQFPLLRPLTVQQAIAIGGGLEGPGGSKWGIRIKRKSGNGQTYEVPASFDDQVEAGDTIIVPRNIFGGGGGGRGLLAASPAPSPQQAGAYLRSSNVAPPEGVGACKKSEVQPHALAYAPGVEMPRQIEAERVTVPSASHSGP
jgi:polysaccharide biosynthesis/export protein